jgi:hypothetical protein
MYGEHLTVELGREILELNRTVESQGLFIEELRLKGAMYKALFFQKSILAEKLSHQITENYNNSVGEFDGFCFASWRARAVYRTLEDMVLQGIITKEEYEFCRV